MKSSWPLGLGASIYTPLVRAVSLCVCWMKPLLLCSIEICLGFRPPGMLLLQWRRRAHPRLSLVLVMLGGFVVALLPMSAILIGVTR